MIPRSRVLTIALSLTTISALPLAAQQHNPPAQCELNYRGNFRLNGAEQHLEVADRTSYEQDKIRRANDALRTLTDAAQAGGGVDQTTLWMFMGRAYALKHDMVGADSSWRKADVTASPACKTEIARLRHNEFVPFQNAGVAAMQQEQWDSALTAFKNGLVINPHDPSVYVNIGSIYMSKNMDDSAVAWWRRAAHQASDPRTENMRATALFNAARLMQRADNWLMADSIFHEYLAMKPRDTEARAALAQVLNSEGRRSAATAIYDSIIADADSLSSFDLFDTGVALFRLAQQDTVRADSAAKDALFLKAAQAFELGLHKNPNERDGLYNLVNTYLALNDTARGLNAAKRLVRVDPMNGMSLRLLAAAYQRFALDMDHTMRQAAAAHDTVTVHRLRPLVQAYQDSTLTALARSDSIPFEVNVDRFDPKDSSATLRGAVVNHLQTEKPPFTLYMDFINEAGEVVSQQSVDVPALGAAGSAGARYDFTLEVTGRGIAAYRYRLE